MPRQSGYAITIRAFIEVGKNDLRRQVAAANAVQKALDGDPGDMLDMAKIDPDGILQKFTTRNMPAALVAAEKAKEPELFEDHSVGSSNDTDAKPDLSAGNGVPGQPGADTRKRKAA